MTLHGLTQRQHAAFQFIRKEIAAGRPSPSYEELMHYLGLKSRGGVHRIVQILIEKRYIVARSGCARSIALAPGGSGHTVHLPPELDAQLSAHVSAWAASPQDVITKAVAEYLGRHA